jgi:thymidylate synthase
MHADQQYLSLVKEVLENGEVKEDRTGVGTISIFGAQRKYDLRKGFPLLTTKKVLFTGIARELLWFLKGSTNINDDLTQFSPIWDAWADPNGELGPIYGYQWIKWPKYLKVEGTENQYDLKPINQIENLIQQIKTNPNSRRLIVSAWNVADIDQRALPPCHLLFQFYVVNGRLDCQLYQRSADVALGVPFNIASYALLMTMIAQECNLIPGIFTHTTGDTHIYSNHVEGLKLQLEREPYQSPVLTVAKKPFWDITFEDFLVSDYSHHPFIKFEVAV